MEKKDIQPIGFGDAFFCREKSLGDPSLDSWRRLNNPSAT
jgi:hypothetical protein